MKRIFLLLFLSFFLGASNDLCAMENGQAHEIYNADAQWPAVKKINENFYVSKVANTFYLTMERVNDSNILDWLKYSARECCAIAHYALKRLNSDGAGHFRNVLKYYNEKNFNKDADLWVVYASYIPKINKTLTADLKAIDMYMSVITAKDALITSHMGISRSWQSAYDLEAYDFVAKQGDTKLNEFEHLSECSRKKIPYQSMYLHAFAAKIMKNIDQKKVFMLTAPTNIMRSIILKKMPQESVFVGDNIYKEELEDKTIPDINKSIILGKWHWNKERSNSVKLERIGDLRSGLVTNPPRIIIKADHFSIQNQNGENLITIESFNQTYQWLFTDPYVSHGLNCPYTLVLLDKLAHYKL